MQVKAIDESISFFSPDPVSTAGDSGGSCWIRIELYLFDHDDVLAVSVFDWDKVDDQVLQACGNFQTDSGPFSFSAVPYMI